MADHLPVTNHHITSAFSVVNLFSTYYLLNRCVFIRIHQADGKNKNGPTKLEYSGIPNRTAYRLGSSGSPLKKVKKCAKLLAKRLVMNITRD